MKTIHIIAISVGVSVVAVFAVLIGYGLFVQYIEQQTFEKQEALIDAIVKQNYTTGFTIVREADGNGTGYWAGASRVWYDEDTELFWLTARIRDPINRGASLEILRSIDGVTFTVEDILLTSSYPGNILSTEESVIVKNPDSGKWQLFLALDQPTRNNDWNIYKLDDIDDIDTDKFDESTATVVLATGSKKWDSNKVKSPKIILRDNEYIMLYAGSASNNRQIGAAYSVNDGANWTRYESNPILDDNIWMTGTEGPHPSGALLFDDRLFFVYDADIEGIGFAIWDKLFNGTARDQNPAETHTAGVRYMDFVVVDNVIYCYYEYENEDKSRDLVVKTIDLTAEIRP